MDKGLLECPICHVAPKIGYACGDYFIHCTDGCPSPACDHAAETTTACTWNDWAAWYWYWHAKNIAQPSEKPEPDANRGIYGKHIGAMGRDMVEGLISGLNSQFGGRLRDQVLQSGAVPSPMLRQICKAKEELEARHEQFTTFLRMSGMSEAALERISFADRISLAALRECEDRRLPMPLKPDELRARIGKPIWIEYALPDGKKACCWVICDIYQDKLLAWKRGIRPWYARGLNPNCIDFDLKDYETFWLTYDHEPNQEHGVKEKERDRR